MMARGHASFTVPHRMQLTGLQYLKKIFLLEKILKSQMSTKLFSVEILFYIEIYIIILCVCVLIYKIVY